MDAARPRIERLAARLGLAPRRAHARLERLARSGSCQRHRLPGLHVGVLVARAARASASAARDRAPSHGAATRRPRRSTTPGPERSARSARSSSRAPRAARARSRASSVTSPSDQQQVRSARAATSAEQRARRRLGCEPQHEQAAPPRRPAPPARAGAPAAAGSARGRAPWPARTGTRCRPRCTTRERHAGDRERDARAASRVSADAARCAASTSAVARDDERAAHQPAPPLRPREDEVEALGVLEVPDQERAGDAPGSTPREHRRRPRQSGVAPVEPARRAASSAARRGTRRPRCPWSTCRGSPASPTARGAARRRQSIAAAELFVRRRMARRHLVRRVALLAPHEEAARPGARAASGSSVAWCAPCRRASGASPSRAAAPSTGSRCTICATSRRRVVEVADQDRLGRAHDDARRLEPDVDAVRAEVALLRRVVLGVDEDRVVRAGGDARLAADADRLVEVDDAVRARGTSPRSGRP